MPKEWPRWLALFFSLERWVGPGYTNHSGQALVLRRILKAIARGGTRTRDPGTKSPMLYRLSYSGLHIIKIGPPKQRALVYTLWGIIRGVWVLVCLYLCWVYIYMHAYSLLQHENYLFKF